MVTLDKLRKDSIVKIKEKVEKNPNYLHPCNKERQDDMRVLKFSSGNEFTYWMQLVGIMKNPIKIRHKIWEMTLENANCKTRKEYEDGCAKRLGYKTKAEQYRDYNREYSYITGVHIPRDINEECSTWFGDFTEDFMIHRYPGAQKMCPNNPGFDYLWNGIKIDCKGRCLQYYQEKTPYWIFPIKWNNIADKFILSGWDNRESLNPLYAWEFNKDDMVRYKVGKGFVMKKFRERDSIGITNNPKGLMQFEKFQVDIGELIDNRRI